MDIKTEEVIKNCFWGTAFEILNAMNKIVKKNIQLKKADRKWDRKSEKQIFTKVIEGINKTFPTMNIPRPGSFACELL